MNQLAEIIPDGILSKLSKMQNTLLRNRMNGAKITDEEQFATVLNAILVTCAIRTELTVFEIETLYRTFERKYKAILNFTEIRLAFEMNEAGDLNERIEHFQVFSVKFMTKVLDCYVFERSKATIKFNELKEKEMLAIEPPKNQTDLIIIKEIRAEANGEDFTTVCTPQMKLELLGELFELEITDEVLSKFRSDATSELITKTITERENNSSKFGKRIDLTNKLARIKSSQISDSDEVEIRLITNRLLYYYFLKKIPLTELNEWIDKTILELQK